MAFALFDRVQETSTTTGTGDFTLSGAISGFKSFASRYSTGDTFYYAVQAVDAVGVPTGEWEVGLGTYSAANTLTRTTVLSSSNSDAAVNFSAGTKRAMVTFSALQGGWIREKLTAARTYYVRTDGSNSNNGLANTAGGAFLTIQYALDVISSTLDIASGVTCTVQVADGTYTATNSVRPIVGAGAVVIQGNSGTPANVVISTTSGHCFSVSRTAVTIKDLKMQTTTSGWALVVTNGATITYSNVDFGACASGHIYTSTGGVVSSSTSYAISGAAPVHVQASLLGEWQSTGGTVTLTGTPNFSTGFVVSSNISAIYAGGTTYSGSATGKRYDATLNSTISSNGGGANFFPGNSAGTTATGGQYA